jgi:hypothetical protein
MEFNQGINTVQFAKRSLASFRNNPLGRAILLAEAGKTGSIQRLLEKQPKEVK